MKTKNIPNKTTAQSLDQKAIDGVNKYFAHVKTLTIAGTTYTPTTFTAVLEAEIAANKAVDETEAQLRQQVVAAKLARAKAQAARVGLKAYILGNSGADAVQMLTDFGISVPKPRGPRTARSKAQAADNATATRKAKKEALASIDANAPSTPAPAAASVVTSPTH